MARTMERKFVFTYFCKKALCSTPEEAIAFIDSLKYKTGIKSLTMKPARGKSTNYSLATIKQFPV